MQNLKPWNSECGRFLWHIFLRSYLSHEITNRITPKALGEELLQGDEGGWYLKAKFQRTY